MGSLIFSVVIGVITLAVMNYYSSKAAAVKENGVRVLRYPRVALVLCLGAFVFLLWICLLQKPAGFELVMWIGVLALFSWWAVECAVGEIRVSVGAIQVRSLLRGRRVFRWDELTGFKELFDGTPKVEATNGNFYVSGFMLGSKALMEDLRRHVALRELETAVTATDAVDSDPAGFAVVHDLYVECNSKDMAKTMVALLDKGSLEFGAGARRPIYEVVLLAASIWSGRNIHQIPSDRQLHGFFEWGKDLELGDTRDEEVLFSIEYQVKECLMLLHPDINWLEEDDVAFADFDTDKVHPEQEETIDHFVKQIRKRLA